MIIAKCKICGDEFRKVRNQLYCEPNCAYKAKRMSENRSSRKWYKKNLEKVRKYKASNMKKYRKRNPEKYNKQSRDAKARIREKIFKLYGNQCVSCGFTDRRALTLDHIKNNGAEERRLLGERGVYYRAIDEYRPEEYQILCMNCQFIKRVEVGRQNQWSHSHSNTFTGDT